MYEYACVSGIRSSGGSIVGCVWLCYLIILDNDLGLIPARPPPFLVQGEALLPFALKKKNIVLLAKSSHERERECEGEREKETLN